MSDTTSGTAGAAVKDTRPEYRCKTKCYWNGVLYREGDLVKSEKTPPVHFEKV